MVQASSVEMPGIVLATMRMHAISTILVVHEPRELTHVEFGFTWLGLWSMPCVFVISSCVEIILQNRPVSDPSRGISIFTRHQRVLLTNFVVSCFLSTSSWVCHTGAMKIQNRVRNSHVI